MKMKKLFKGFILAVPMIFMVGCGTTELSDKYNEQDLKTTSATVIDEINENNYVAVVDRMSEELKASVPEGKLKEVFDPLHQKVGAFKEIKEFAAVEKDGLAITQSAVSYEKGQLIITLNYDENEKLVGIFVK